MIQLLIGLIVIGVVLWLVNTYVPMDSKIKSVFNIVVLIAVLLWVLGRFGVLGGGDIESRLPEEPSHVFAAK